MRTLAVVLLLGCGVSRLEVEPSVEASGSGEALQAARCQPYPWTVNVGPDGRAAAEQELAALAPAATLQWSSVRNTPAAIFNAGFTLECPHGKDAVDAWLDFVAAHPALFRVDPTEWQRTSYPCASLSASPQWASLTRATYAGQPARADSFAFYVRAGAKPETMVVQAVAGSWIPPARYTDRLALARCASLDPDAAEQSARAAKLAYRVFFGCAPVGDYTYRAAPADRVELDPSAFFEWSEQSGAVVLRKVHPGRLVLDPSSYTPELLQSDANCPSWGGAPQVGFELSFDSVTAELLRQKPGIGCIVCLTQ